MRVLGWSKDTNYHIRLGSAMPSEYGGVQLIAGDELYNEIYYNLRREIVGLFLIVDDEVSTLIVRFFDEDGEENLCGFSVQLTPEEYHTYLDLIG